VFTVTRAQLAQKLNEKHGVHAAISAERDKQSKVVADLKAAGASTKQVAREQARLDRLEAALPVPARGGSLTTALEAHADGQISGDELTMRQRTSVLDVLADLPKGALRDTLQDRMLSVFSSPVEDKSQLLDKVREMVRIGLNTVDKDLLKRLGESRQRELAEEDPALIASVQKPYMSGITSKMVNAGLGADAETRPLEDDTVAQRARDSVSTAVERYEQGMRAAREALLAQRQSLLTYTPAALNTMIARLRSFADTEAGDLLVATEREWRPRGNAASAHGLNRDRALDRVQSARQEMAAAFDAPEAAATQREIAHKELSKYVEQYLQEIHSEMSLPQAEMRRDAADELGYAVTQAMQRAFRKKVFRENLRAYEGYIREIEEE